ncbi:centromere protein U isoform X2 [Microtus oregoni]|uniref:centromere protein U isoform X2 n=1 Tax=Microtus oregoni TaxID=111838 RepID=UPI001BB1B950|nr:centromere protein U isoform X2 [Microtus oregoni]
MAARRSLRYPRSPGAKQSKNALGRTHSRRHRAGQKHKPKDPFDFADNSASSMLGEMGDEELLNESFDPPLHSTVIDAKEELPKRPPVFPATHGREEGRSLNLSETEARGSSSLKSSTKKPRRKLEPISDEFESSEDDVRRKVKSTERTHAQQPQKTQKKVRLSPGRRKKSRSEATDSDASESMHIWCLEGKRRGDIMELDVILSVFEKTFLEYKQGVASERCCQAINKFYFKIKGELFRMIKEEQVLRAVKRKNTQMISNMEKKRQRLIEVQDELLRLEPQLKQLQTKYDDLKERKSSLKNSIHFLSNLKQLYGDYSDVQEKEPKEKEEYDSSSLPALLFKARTILGAKKHLKTINYQLGKLLEQE